MNLDLTNVNAPKVPAGTPTLQDVRAPLGRNVIRTTIAPVNWPVKTPFVSTHAVLCHAVKMPFASPKDTLLGAAVKMDGKRTRRLESA